MNMNPIISTAAELAAVNPSLKKGQMAIESDTGFIKVAQAAGAFNSIDYLPLPVRKALGSDQTVTGSTTLVKVTGLELPVKVSGKYFVRLVIYFTTTTAAGLRYRHRGPSTPSRVSFERKEILPGATAFNTVEQDNAYSAADETLTVGSTSEGKIEIYGYLVNGASAGDIEFAFAQNVSDAGNTVIKAGSYAEYTQVI